MFSDRQNLNWGYCLVSASKVIKHRVRLEYRNQHQTVLQYCLSRDRGDCSARRQICHLENHPKDILHSKNHLYRIVLVHLTSDDVFKTRKHLQMVDIQFLKNHKDSKFRLTCLTNCLTTFASLDTKRSIVQPQFYATTTNSPVQCAFWGSDECGASAPHCSFTFHQALLLLHAAIPY